MGKMKFRLRGNCLKTRRSEERASFSKAALLCLFGKLVQKDRILQKCSWDYADGKSERVKKHNTASQICFRKVWAGEMASVARR